MKNRQQKEIYDREFKLRFMGEGEWLDEPDKVAFEYKGFKCLVVRVVEIEPFCPTEAYFGGHLCGYILLPKDHYLYGKKGEDLNLNCHGGVTRTEAYEEDWMVGFDCAHCGDLVPTMKHLRNTTPEGIKKHFPPPKGMEKHPWFHPTYKTMDFCIKECKSMAREAAKL